jgi:hypothetical protein
VFFWNNLIGRFTRVDAPAGLQYASAHRNSPGKYLIELPLYLWPWTLLVLAAARRAWRQRRAPPDEYRAARFALAAFLPALAVLSVAATARNIYLAPALPGAALLLGWWASELHRGADRWDLRALRATAALLLLAVITCLAAVALLGADAWTTLGNRTGFVAISAAGLLAAALLAIHAWVATGRGQWQRAQGALLLSCCALLIGPASQAYGRVDEWQNLAAIGAAVERDAAGKPLILFAPDETTRAMIDMYARVSVTRVAGPIDAAAIARLRAAASAASGSRVVVLLPGRAAFGHRIPEADPPWLTAAQLRVVKRYALPNGRRYALLEAMPSGASHQVAIQ